MSLPGSSCSQVLMDGTLAGAGGADWKAYLARNPAQVKRRVRKGIPNALRSMAWQLLSGSRDLLLQNPGAHLWYCRRSRNDQCMIYDLNVLTAAVGTFCCPEPSHRLWCPTS